VQGGEEGEDGPQEEDKEDEPFEPAGELMLQTMAGEFFQHSENLYARRQLTP